MFLVYMIFNVFFGKSFRCLLEENVFPLKIFTYLRHVRNATKWLHHLIWGYINSFRISISGVACVGHECGIYVNFYLLWLFIISRPRQGLLIMW